MDDDLNLNATLTESVATVLDRINEKIDTTKDELDDLNAAGRRAGAGVDQGAEQAEEALDDLERQAKRTSKATDEVGESAQRSGRKARSSVDGWAKLEAQHKRNAKALGGYTKLLKLLKMAAIVTAVFALAGALSALGAGAFMAVGGVGALLPGLLALGPIGLAAALGVKAAKLGLKELEPQVAGIKSEFAGLGPAVAAGGLGKGLTYLRAHISDFADEAEQGFGWIGGSLGRASIALGDFLSDSYRLDQTEKMFWSVSNVIDTLTPGVLGFGGGLINVLVAALPAGERLAGVISGIGESFEQWTRAQLESGRATEVINKGLDLMLRAGGVLTDLIVGLYRIFRIAAQEAGGLGLSIEEGARRFKEWTGSAAGQQAIRDYFKAAIPAIRETFLLLGAIFKMFGKLAASQDVAPLLAQIRTEFLPALGELLAKLSGQDGLGPALIEAATALFKFFAVIDLSALTLLLSAIVGLLDAIAWIAVNVPGAGFVLSALLTTVLLLGPAFKIAGYFAATMGRFAKIGTWLAAAALGAGKLTIAQRILNTALNLGKIALFNLRLAWFAMGGAAGIVSTIMTGVTWVARGMWVAITGPVGLVILAILAVVAIIVYLWNNCEWFRDAVIATWEWIKNAAVVAWNAIVEQTMWAIGIMGDICTWLWVTIIQPIWNAIVTVAQVAWAIIVFIVRVAVYIIAAILALLIWIGTSVWNAISEQAVWAWQTIILPIIQFVVGIIITIWNGIVAFFAWVWGVVVQQASFAWNGVILPLIQFVASILMAIWTPIAAFFTWLWGIISQQASFAWNGVILPLLQMAASVVMAVWRPIAAFFTWLWNVIVSQATFAWNAISGAASSVAGVVKGVWNSVVSAVKGAYNVLARAWNSIPSVSVLGYEISLPKLPTLWHGGTVTYGTALVGEHGPEPLVVNGRYAGMVGAGGPEVATGLPRGGYVVPNLDTLTRMPGLLKTIPSGVASAVARSVPGYGDLLRPPSAPPPPPHAGSGRDDRELVGAVRGLARAVTDRPPPISADGADTEAKVLRALRRHDREKELRGRYRY